MVFRWCGSMCLYYFLQVIGQMIAPNKRRSRRLRKKLHVGEFKEMGFEFEVDFRSSVTPEEEETLVDCFLAEIVEPRSLAFSGSVSGGFIAHYGRGSASEEDRALIQSWLLSRPEIEEVRVGALKDAWHFPE